VTKNWLRLFILARQGSDLHIIQKIELGLKTPVKHHRKCLGHALLCCRTLVSRGAGGGFVRKAANQAHCLGACRSRRPAGQLLAHNDTKLIVTDSFGGRVAVINLERDELDIGARVAHTTYAGPGLEPRPARNCSSRNQTLNGLAQTTL